MSPHPLTSRPDRREYHARRMELIVASRPHWEADGEADEARQSYSVRCTSVLLVLHHVSPPLPAPEFEKYECGVHTDTDADGDRLLFMTYNGWVMLAVAVGAFVGFMLFSGSSATKTAACH
jgi:hypothetical protein